MRGQMQDWPLRVGTIIDHAARYHPRRSVVGRRADGAVFRTDWEAVRLEALKLTQAIRRLGIAPGTVIGDMAWNSPRHLALWYGVPGAGCALHTLNPRLSGEQLTYIIGHAEDAAVFVDADLVGVLEPLAAALPQVRHWIVLAESGEMPETTLPGALCYGDLIAAEDGDAAWEPVDEGHACGICYTSGTTGAPKGVVYSHRSNVLHAMAMIQPDMLGLSSRDMMMPVVPLFHANGWSSGFSAPMAGAGMVLPGRWLDPASLLEMIAQGVTVTAAVPTVWLPLLAHLREHGGSLTQLNRVVIGGSACPRAVIEAFQNDYGVKVLHAWGMTETSPLGSFSSFKPEIEALDAEGQMAAQLSVGHPPYTVDLALRDEDGAWLPRDGQTPGRLQIRGPGVVGQYLKAEAPEIDDEGWFDTGDAATIDTNGYVRITDRFKDLIKSGGEWISSIEMENAAVAHPGVAEAAAVAIPHPKWGERPVLVVVAKGAAPEPAAVLALLEGQFAKWQLPDEVLFVDEIPHTATGKISKLTLRRQLEDQGYMLPDQR
ncbi:MAG: long-chain-fatty-acid--CoA ligase [Pseudomonadota bacterium]